MQHSTNASKDASLSLKAIKQNVRKMNTLKETTVKNMDVVENDDKIFLLFIISLNMKIYD